MAAVLLAACSTAPAPTATPGSAAQPAIPSPTRTGSPSAPPTAVATPGPTIQPPIAHVTATLASFRLPTPVSRAVAFPDGTSVLVCGGLTPAGTTAAVVLVDLGKGSALRRGTLAAPVHDAAGATLGGSMFVFGGGQAVAEAAVQRMSAAGSSSVIGRLPVARADEAAVTVDNEMVVLGGALNSVLDRSVLATTDGVSFRTIATLAVGVRYAAVAALDGTVYLFGGAGSGGDVATVQAIDVATGTVQRLVDLPRTMSHATAIVLDGRIVLAGGRHAGKALDTILAFDPATGRTMEVGRLPEAMSDAAGTVIGSTAYLLGGEAGGPLDTVVLLTAG